MVDFACSRYTELSAIYTVPFTVHLVQLGQE